VYAVRFDFEKGIQYLIQLEWLLQNPIQIHPINFCFVRFLIFLDRFTVLFYICLNVNTSNLNMFSSDTNNL